MQVQFVVFLCDIYYLAQDVGYTYINIDDCYSEKNRSASGDIVASASFHSTTTVVVYQPLFFLLRQGTLSLRYE